MHADEHVAAELVGEARTLTQRDAAVVFARHAHPQVAALPDHRRHHAGDIERQHLLARADMADRTEVVAAVTGVEHDVAQRLEDKLGPRLGGRAFGRLGFLRLNLHGRGLHRLGLTKRRLRRSWRRMAHRQHRQRREGGDSQRPKQRLLQPTHGAWALRPKGEISNVAGDRSVHAAIVSPDRSKSTFAPWLVQPPTNRA